MEHDLAQGRVHARGGIGRSGPARPRAARGLALPHTRARARIERLPPLRTHEPEQDHEALDQLGLGPRLDHRELGRGARGPKLGGEALDELAVDVEAQVLELFVGGLVAGVHLLRVDQHDLSRRETLRSPADLALFLALDLTADQVLVVEVGAQGQGGIGTPRVIEGEPRPTIERRVQVQALHHGYLYSNWGPGPERRSKRAHGVCDKCAVLLRRVPVHAARARTRGQSQHPRSGLDPGTLRA